MHSAGQMRGKAVMAVEDDQTETKQQNGEFSIVLLLNLLNQPLYLRSVAHLEQVLSFCVLYSYHLFYVTWVPIVLTMRLWV